MINVPLARKVRETVATDPESWHQGSWRVGKEVVRRRWSSWLDAIAAGRVYTEAFRPEFGLTPQQARARLAERGPVCGSAYCVAGWATFFTLPEHLAMSFSDVITVEGSKFEATIGEWARRELGLTDAQAERLFCGSNSHTEVLRLLDELIAQGEKELTDAAG